MQKRRSPRTQFIIALLISSFVGLGLFAYGAVDGKGVEYSYMPWNLLLAWLPLLFAIRLAKVLKRKRWSSWEGLATSVLWLVFLPNSFYMISDLIHLQEAQRSDVLYDAVMFTSFIYTGVMLGFSSLYLVHLKLRRRLSGWAAAGWAACTLLICSVGIYVGRNLRWNSWDIITNPDGLLFDLSDRILHPATYPQMFVTILSFFVLLASMYGLIWRGAGLLRQASAQPPARPVPNGGIHRTAARPDHPNPDNPHKREHLPRRLVS